MPSISRKLSVPEEHAGQRLDRVAAILLPEFSRSRLKQWIDEGCLTVGGARTVPKTRVRGGETIELSADLEAESAVLPEPIPLEVIAKSPAYFVIDKPPGQVVHPGAGNRAGTMQNALLHLDPNLSMVPRAGIVHRLDKDTSGLLVVARTLEAQKHLSEQIVARSMHRTYRAVCHGVFTGGGSVDAPLGRHRTDRTRIAVVSGGRPARTHYRVLERFRAQTLLELMLDTGRTHQIRVHMAHIGHPLVGDPVYGGRPRLPRGPSQALVDRLQQFRRQALHACRLTFEDPETAERVGFDSPLAADIESLLAALRDDTDGA